jgi:SAM-dependent methyltransferase
LNEKEHWEQIYSTRRTENLGWFAPHLEASLSWIKDAKLILNAPIIDVGGGASTLVDDLLDLGHQSITVLDISTKALTSVKARLGKKAELVTWIVEDISNAQHLPIHYYELWHDRAVFHFLTELEQQRKYRDNLLTALKPGGHLIIGTFTTEAPPKCSGLPVRRYTPNELESTLGAEFELKRHRKALHITPGGVEQMYLYCYFHRRAKAT